MAIPVAIFGKSGSGKSRSAKNMIQDGKTFLIQCVKKPLPFKGKFEKSMVTSDANVIRVAMTRAVENGMKSIIVDDAGYIMTDRFMRNHRSLKGNAAFELYNDIADEIYFLIDSARELPEDVIVYFVFHEEMDEFGNYKLKTLGKLLNDKVCLEGMVTVCLRCQIIDGKHYFVTNSDEGDITKSPEEMFPDKLIENDLKAVDSAIRAYYEI